VKVGAAGFLALLVLVAAVFAWPRHRPWSRGGSVSCANHTIQLRGRIRDFCRPGNRIFPRTTDTPRAFREIFEAIEDPDLEWLAGPGAACPEAFERNASMGYVYIAAGLTVETVMTERALVFFCPSTSHRGKDQHAHAVRGDAEDIDLGCVKDNAEMVAVLADAVARGEKGTIPYSPEAMDLLRRELAARSP
jgi:hypothetical protein